MKVIVATKNKHKLTEFSRILEPLGYQLISQEEVCPGIEVEEEGGGDFPPHRPPHHRR